MKLNLDIKKSSSPEWIATVMSNFDEFLKDHADCERKASAMAMSFVAKYPDRKEMIPDLIETALEELEHFKLVYEIMEQRGIPLPTQMSEDPYIKALLKTVRTGLNERLMDRLLIASVAETRGAERFRMVEEALDDVDLKKFYKMLWTSEAKHGHIYIKMALHYFSSDVVYSRLEYWLDEESKIIEELPLRPALH
ncbi:MAG: tRNA-(ms[2]io[6]A)-hydroxylase [Saprospiraceae bacterium]|nr:tRNA-(ms[2]io[6]A)-hydroxylase [Saprospiraceae bacterium]MBK7468939.1 tRNA-(ms[2]io[6]A)-hydroxylase [Saprospiraceae bacterium]MBK9995241.1 tRNA-(ms[2]io[6]A)-hydroxylase [Saprospiraceae bacterium]